MSALIFEFEELQLAELEFYSSALSVYRVAEAGLHQWVRVELGPNTCYQQWAGWEVSV